MCVFIQTFRTKKTNGVVGADVSRTLLSIEAPESHCRVCVDHFPSLSSRDPFCGSGFDGSWALTHSGAVIEANGIQLFVVSTSSRVVNIVPRGPLVII